MIELTAEPQRLKTYTAFYSASKIDEKGQRTVENLGSQTFTYIDNPNVTLQSKAFLVASDKQRSANMLQIFEEGE